MNNTMEQLRKEYQDVPIPDELANVVSRALHKLSSDS